MGGSEQSSGARRTSDADFDWSGTPLGPVDTWSDRLRAAVDDAVRRRDVAADVEMQSLSPAAVLDALFDAAPLGLAVWDNDLRFVRVNRSLADMNGLPIEAHIGRTPAEILPDIAGIDELLKRWRHVLDSGTPWLNVEVHGGTPGADDKNRTWNEQFFPVRAGDRIVGLGAVVEEITERRRVEDALRASEARFREFAAASADVLWIRNTETRKFEFISAGVVRLYHEPKAAIAETMRSFDWLEAILPEDRAGASAALQQVRGGTPVTHDFRARIPGSGKVRWLKNTAFPLYDHDGAVRRIGGIVQDVTEERLAAQRLNILIAELQHRTRNLMSVVQATAENTLEASADLAEFATAFRARIAALSRVQNLLSRLDGLERIGFDELLRTELAAVGASPEPGGRVILDGPTGVPLRSGGIQTLALAIHELLTNAVKHGALSQPQATLQVRWRLERVRPGERATLRVEWVESGVRMPDDAGQAARDGGGGQGRELIERALPYQLDAQTRFELTADGVHCTIVLPVSGTLTDGIAA
jgi:PAS domain S-box-containing protein